MRNADILDPAKCQGAGRSGGIGISADRKWSRDGGWKRKEGVGGESSREGKMDDTGGGEIKGLTDGGTATGPELGSMLGESLALCL